MRLSLPAQTYEQAKWEVYLDLYVEAPKRLAWWRREVWEKIPLEPTRKPRKPW